MAIYAGARDLNNTPMSAEEGAGVDSALVRRLVRLADRYQWWPEIMQLDDGQYSAETTPGAVLGTPLVTPPRQARQQPLQQRDSSPVRTRTPGTQSPPSPETPAYDSTPSAAASATPMQTVSEGVPPTPTTPADCYGLGGMPPTPLDDEAADAALISTPVPSDLLPPVDVESPIGLPPMPDSPLAVPIDTGDDLAVEEPIRGYGVADEFEDDAFYTPPASPDAAVCQDADRGVDCARQDALSTPQLSPLQPDSPRVAPCLSPQAVEPDDTPNDAQAGFLRIARDHDDDDDDDQDLGDASPFIVRRHAPRPGHRRVVLSSDDDEHDDNNGNAADDDDDDDADAVLFRTGNRRVVILSDSEEDEEQADGEYKQDGSEQAAKRAALDSLLSNQMDVICLDDDVDDDDDDDDDDCDINAQAEDSCDTGSRYHHRPVSKNGDTSDKENQHNFASPLPKAMRDALLSPSRYAEFSVVSPLAGAPRGWSKERDELARRFYDSVNRRVYQDRLPMDMSIEWSKRLNKTAGLTYTKRSAMGQRSARIELSTKVVDAPGKLKQTLAHEMAHVAAWLIDGTNKPPHGKSFKKWARATMAAVPGIHVTTCHSYEIAYKHRWQCVNPECARIYGRHTRSINIATQGCGVCHSRLTELTRTRADGTPIKARAVTGFALFVKQHYSQVKSERPRATHRDVMSTLSAMWRNRS